VEVEAVVVAAVEAAVVVEEVAVDFAVSEAAARRGAYSELPVARVSDATHPAAASPTP
jgi:hypothetical protein